MQIFSLFSAIFALLCLAKKFGEKMRKFSLNIKCEDFGKTKCKTFAKKILKKIINFMPNYKK